MNDSRTLPVFLLATEPAAVEIFNEQGKRNLVLVCDHASNRVPECLQQLGLNDVQLADHIGWDPGAAAVARLLAQDLDAPLLLSGYSRLVIDCNRPLASSDLIPQQSAGVIIPGNQNLSSHERDQRIKHLFIPYHQAIEKLVAERTLEQTLRPIAFLSIHSFTPFLFNQQRPWHIGVSHKSDDRFAQNLYKALVKQEDIIVGLNEPYPIEDAFDYSIPVHGEARGLPSAMIEIRQDGLTTQAGIEQWAKRIAQAYRTIELEF
ncbi:N-formylglutamate amidohydrolase [Cellvibrio sp. OA-2007]|uniref:N-formylglutamate amidohydrolase n=1 Tax=Cellvibrio sp. OA-2007 TaxID=529823 RepID=UPI000786053D|nr:N-formylglutamate amidohydrolase [Cellvibrio sp. OA-2007]